MSGRASIHFECPSCAKAVRVELLTSATDAKADDGTRVPSVSGASLEQVACAVRVAATYRKTGEVSRAEGIEQALSMLGLTGPTVGAEGKKIRREIDLLATPKEKPEKKAKSPGPQEKQDAIDRVLRAASWASGFSSVAPVTLAVLSGYSPTSSSFVATIATLVDCDWLQRVHNGLRLSQSGRSNLADEGPVPPTSEELRATLRRKLGKCPAAVLQAIVDRPGATLMKATIAELTGYSSTSSSFNDAFAELKSKGLIEGHREYAPTKALLDAFLVAR